MLVWFGLWTHNGATLASVEQHRSQLLLLGLGTSLGVLLQGVALLPSLRAAGLHGLRWRWDPSDVALRTVIRLGGWTFGFVVANQICIYVVTLLAGTAPGSDPVSSYTYAYAFLQLPYGIVAVTIMSVVTPDLAERWASGRRAAFVTRVASGLRAMLALIVPAAVGMLLLAKPAVALVLGHGHSTPTQTSLTGATLALFAIGLPGFCTYLYVVRVLQSMQLTKVAFFLYLGENGMNIALALGLIHSLGVRGLALSLSVAYTVSALVGLAILRKWFGPLGTHALWAPLRRAVAASVAMGVVVLAVSNISGAMHGVRPAGPGGGLGGRRGPGLRRSHHAARAPGRGGPPGQAGRQPPAAAPRDAAAAAPRSAPRHAPGPASLRGATAESPWQTRCHARRPYRDRQCL